MVKLFNNIGISVTVLCILSLTLAQQKGTSFVVKHLPKKNLEVGIVSHKEKCINGHPLLGGLKVKTQGSYMSARYFEGYSDSEDDSDDDTKPVVTCLTYLKTTLIVCNSDYPDGSNTLCNNICKNRKELLSGTCEDLDTFPVIVGPENIVIEEDENPNNVEAAEDNQNNEDEVQVVRPNGSFKGVKFASLDESTGSFKGIEKGDEFNGIQDQGNTFQGIIRETEVLRRLMGCFCCIKESQR